ncbi:hypothetical protein TI04_08455 [Achromatium sp. WMS2]|nr:hypothetical protein TI04_08455 [Achromatium sp. WMS2]
MTNWRTLYMFMAYRLVLALSMGFAFFFRINPTPLGSAFPKIFAITIVIYLGLVLSSVVLLVWKTPSAEQQVQIALCIDIVAITMLMHASGGVASGLGLLIAISITLGSLLTGGHLAIPFAALSSLAVLGEQLYAESFGVFLADPATYTQAGLLGVMFFAVAMLAYGLARQLRDTEKLAQQRGLDLANMAQVNEYIIQHMNTGIIVLDKNWTVRLLNDTAWYLLGTPRVKVGDNLKWHLPDLAHQVFTWLHSSANIAENFQLRPGEREIRLQFVSLDKDQRGGILIFLEDRARLLEQAQQIKLASLGRLTASIAHEIRNPLGAISHAGQLLAESIVGDESDRRLLEIIRGNSQRVNDVIEAILQLSRRSRAHSEYVNLYAWTVQFVQEFCSSRMLDPNPFKIHIKPSDIFVQTDVNQLNQVLENICDNALRYGKPYNKAHHISLFGGINAEVPWPTLEICDNGSGIPAEHIRQIFEPFFTTAVKGTGLGLYIARELCEINQIDLEYIKDAKQGSCFRLSFHNWRDGQ